MSLVEACLFFLNLLLVAVVLLRLLRHENPILFWSPLMFITVSWAYYSVVGPVYLLWTSDFTDRGQDMRPLLSNACLGGITFFVFLLIGYRSARGFAVQVPHQLHRPPSWGSEALGRKVGSIGAWMMVLGCALFAVGVGTGFFTMLNPFAVSADETSSAAHGGAFQNYFLFAIQFFIPACTLLLLAARRSPRYRWVFVVSLAVTTAIYLSISFRYRVLMLIVSLCSAFYLDRWKRPAFGTLSLAGLVAVLLMGFIGATRDYGLGLRLDRVGDESLLASSIRNGVGDAGIFLTSGGVIDVVPDRLQHAMFAPIRGAVLLPIPSAIYSDKNTNQYLEDLIAVIYGRETAGGAAYMFFAEWYYAFSWFGIVGASFLFGYVLGRLWTWFLHRHNDILALTAYASVMPLSYVALSRGYFAQFVMVAVFSALPIYLVYRWKGLKPGAAAVPHSRGAMPPPMHRPVRRPLR